MRGKIAKGLRNFSKHDMSEAPWATYVEVQMSHHSPNKTVRLTPDCQKYHYKQMKKVWKMF